MDNIGEMIKMINLIDLTTIDGLTPAEYYKDKPVPYDKLITINEESQTARVGGSAFFNPYYESSGYLESKGWEVLAMVPGTGSSTYLLKRKCS